MDDDSKSEDGSPPAYSEATGPGAEGLDPQIGGFAAPIPGQGLSTNPLQSRLGSRSKRMGALPGGLPSMRPPAPAVPTGSLPAVSIPSLGESRLGETPMSRLDRRGRASFELNSQVPSRLPTIESNVGLPMSRSVGPPSLPSHRTEPWQNNDRSMPNLPTIGF